jgi:hypothetical protein
MNPRLDKDKTELGVAIFPVDFEVLAHSNRLFNEVPEVLRDGWAKSYPQIKGIFSILNSKEGGREREVVKRYRA